jgi:hypothetical protein
VVGYDDDVGLREISVCQESLFGSALDVAGQQRTCTARGDRQHAGAVVVAPGFFRAGVQELERDAVPDPCLAALAWTRRYPRVAPLVTTVPGGEHRECLLHGRSPTGVVVIGVAGHQHVQLCDPLVTQVWNDDELARRAAAPESGTGVE